MDIQFKIDKDQLLALAGKLKGEIDQAVKESFDELPIQETYRDEYHKSGLQEQSGALINNLKTERPDDNTLIISLDKEYARIHNYGGKNGRNHSATQIPRYYFTNTAKALWEILKEKIKTKISK